MTTRLITCDGDWVLYENGSFTCSGQLGTVTSEQLAQTGSSEWSAEDRHEMYQYTIELFVGVFCILLMKKVISR